MAVSGASHVNPQIAYYLNDFENGNPMYVGKSAGGNLWLVQKYNQSTGEMVYAVPPTNPGILTYEDAWAARGTLNYARYQAT